MLRSLLEENGFVVVEAGSAEKALTLLEEERPEVVLLDLVLPGASGLESLSRFRKELPGTPVIMMSGEATLADAVRATREGAFHFLEKPLSPEAVLVTLRAALEVSRARALSRALREELGASALLVGSSAAMERVRDTIRKVAPTEARVLIEGESGTGKELAATAIHELSPRRGGPFVRVNSAAIPRDLVESEMFGHERGAFTGATSRRLGRFELAHGGTLFLDEVGDLGAEAQGKLLRVLESGTLERLGGHDPIRVDVRVLAATNRELRREAEAGRFREDLLFRLDVVPLRMPPLRERPEDLPILAEHIAERLRRREGLVVPELSPAAMEELAAHSWPGNVRELINLFERLSILHAGRRVEPEGIRHALDSPHTRAASVPNRRSDSPSLRERLDEHEAELIRDALRAARENVAEAARRLRTDRANLYRRMKRLGIRTDD
ncbi:MAG: sigma-54-dependent Fis family transcriptional regulator [Gemmatimonadetes bacterium]|nr:sigma-54-dependent Fis family transcriptional regulator [Gemmatimonadota bacterium]